MTTCEEIIPEEGLTNLIKVEQYKRINSYACSEDIDEADRIIQIKMPKNF
jgi:hypothetical protein